MSGNYRLRWLDSVTRDLLQATSRVEPAVQQTIFAAIADVEAILEKEAETADESREPGIRLLINSPPTITYSVNTRLREVFIFRARVFRTKP